MSHAKKASRIRHVPAAIAPVAFAACVLSVACGGAGSAPGQEAPAAQTSAQLTLTGITLQTVLVPRFVGATNNGGSTLTATASAAQAWETFSLVDINGGSLASGDSVYVQAGNGQYLQALNGGGASLNAGSVNTQAWETFKVFKQTGTGTLNNGDVIGLQANTGSWVSALNGGGGALFAYGGSLGSWEQFKINGLPAVVTTPTPPVTPPVTPPGTTSTTVSNVSFRAGTHYLGATNGGGSTVIATATAVQGWETFSIVDVNGGSLVSGDSVYVKSSTGQYLQALNGGGSSLNAGSTNTQAWETFKLVKQGGSGTINSGDTVGLQASTGSWVSAENGGGGNVLAYGGALGSWESFAIGIGAASAPPVTTPTAGWKVVWSDEFNGANGSAVDSSKWNHDTGGTGFGNNELEYYTADTANSQQYGGNLVITATAAGASSHSCWYGTCQYTSGRILTAGHYSAQYGRVEARVKMPAGKGLWPAFWMLGDNIASAPWPSCGEIDIMEAIGSDTRTNHGSMHGPGYSGGSPLTATVQLPGSVKLSDDFHVYAVEWSPNLVQFYVDSTLYETRTPADIPSGTQWVYNHPFFILLNLAVGGTWPGTPDGSAQFPVQMLVDYVRVSTK